MFESLLEAVELDSELDESLQRFRPALPRPVEISDRCQPVPALRIDASKEDAVLEDQVYAQHPPVDLDRLCSGVDPADACDSAAAELTQRPRHQLGGPGRSDPE